MSALMGGHGLPEPQIVFGSGQHLAMVRATVDVNSIPEFYDRAYPLIYSSLSRRGIAPSGAPIGISFSWPTETIDLGAAVPVSMAIEPDGEVTTFRIPSGPAAKVSFRGSYDQLPMIYSHIRAWLEHNGYSLGHMAWEQYVTEPRPNGNPDDNLTDVYWLVG